MQYIDATERDAIRWWNRLSLKAKQRIGGIDTWKYLCADDIRRLYINKFMDTNTLLVETSPKVQQWEYTSMHFLSGQYDLPELNAMGAQGWELCTLTEGKSIDELIFKRPKQ